MNLIEKWKNHETKKKLREENIRLREENKCLRNIPRPNVCTIERNIQKIRALFYITEHDLPVELAKEDIKRNMIREIEPFIDWDIKDGVEVGHKYIIGTIYVATGDRKYEA